ncbi:hypothetical protein PC123_g27626 [Phytophthora cactorum]|nr:hypothetical protein PC123_g27626 [Phytophthora cactorum]
MLHHAKLDKCFWAETAITVIYVKNLMEGMDLGHEACMRRREGRRRRWDRSEDT